MAEVNTIIITTAVATIVALAAVVFCVQPSESSNNNNLEKAHKDKININNNAKPKKKSNKSKAKKHSEKLNINQSIQSIATPVIPEKADDVDEDDISDDDLVMPVIVTAKKTKTKKANEKSKEIISTKNESAIIKEKVAEPKNNHVHLPEPIKESSKIHIEPPVSITAKSIPIPVQKENGFITTNSIELNTSQIDDWAVVEKKSKAIKKSEEDLLNEELLIKPPVIVEPDNRITETFKVDAKKVGSIIGPKGATKIALQNASGAEILFPKTNKDSSEPVEVTIIGEKENVAKAKKAVIDIVTKGYAPLLAGEDFRETQVTVHHAYLPEIIGTKGATVKMIQDKLNVRITIPNNMPGTTTLKIGVAGLKDDVIKTKAIIKELVQFHHTEVTHPGYIHEELDNIAGHYYNYIIGPKGSEIKHIQANFKVSIYIPNEYSLSRNILIVGLPNHVENAKKYILKIIENIENGSINNKKNSTSKAAQSSGTTNNANTSNASSTVINDPAVVDENIPDSLDAYVESRNTVITFGDLITTAKHVSSNGIPTTISQSNVKDDEESDSLGPKPTNIAPTSGWATSGTAVLTTKFS